MGKRRSEPARRVLAGVPQVRFYDGGPRCPEDVPFPSCVRAVLEYLGDQRFGCRHAGAPGPANGDRCVHCTYAYLMGTSGAAFHLNWAPGWEGDNGSLTYMSDEPDAPFDRALASIGYTYEIVSPDEGDVDRARCRERIVESIRDRGVPAIGFGVVGPPEACVIAGYERPLNGDELTLIGWSYFQELAPFDRDVDRDPLGYFRVRDGLCRLERLVVLGERVDLPPMHEVYAAALRWALQVVRTPVTHGDRRNGLAAYAAWADHLLRDEDFEDPALLYHCFAVHDDAVGTVAEGRWYASLFLVEAVDHLPYTASEDLLHAAACYAGEHNLMWQVWDLVGGIGRSDDRAQRLADPRVRREIVPLIHEARAKEASAAAHVERVLQALGAESGQAQ